MSKYIPYIILAVSVVVLFFSLTNRKEVVIEKTTTDTVYMSKIDTIKVILPTFVTDTVIDTIYVENEDGIGVKLPISQKYYSADDYKAWVSGYKPNLDSIEVYSKKEYITITNNTVREIYPKTTDLFLTVGTNYINRSFSPNVGINVKFKNDLMLGGEIGYFDKNIIYGVKVGFKLNKNNK